MFFIEKDFFLSTGISFDSGLHEDICFDVKSKSTIFKLMFVGLNINFENIYEMV